MNRQLQISAERTIKLANINYVACSTLKDDWFATSASSAQEPDPLLNCVFKTEFFTQLKMAKPGGLDLRIGDQVQYNKKPGKPATIKAVKDNTIARDDVYKSGEIHTSQGESSSSVSAPTPKGKAVAPPVTTGKLIRPGGPNGQPSKPRTATPRPGPQARPLPQSSSQPRAVSQPAAALVNGTSHTRNESASARPPPPPSPAVPPPAAQQNIYRALFDFTGQTEGELTIVADDLLEVIKKEGNGMNPTLTQLKSVIVNISTGWWLAKRISTGVQAWAPSAYLKEEAPPPAAARAPPPPPPAPPATNGTGRPAAAAAKAKPTPPVPPTKRPIGKKPAAAPAPRDSAVSMGLSGSGRDTPDSNRSQTPSLAGGLAEALRARQASMQGKAEDDDDW